MKIAYLFVVIIALLSRGLGASGIQADLENISQNKILKEGDIFDGYLRIWPGENVDTSIIKRLEGKTLVNYFHVAEVKKIQKSINNSDVIEVFLTMILLKEFKVREFYLWDIDNRVIPIKLKNFKTEKSIKIKNYHYEEQALSVESDFKPWMIVLTGVISLIILSSLLCLQIKKRNKLKKKKKRREDWSHIFMKAKGMSDYIEIYQLREEWLDEIGIVTPPINDFFITLNKHQYKRTFQDSEIYDVENKFDEIKGMFK